jgi:hypothetical protein
MTPQQIDDAQADAERFIARCEAAKAAFQFRKFKDGTGGYWANEDTKATAALKRASMDLTRALVPIRRIN